MWYLVVCRKCTRKDQLKNLRRETNTKQNKLVLWWLKLKKFLRGRIEDLRLGTKIRENLCRFCLLRKDFVSKFDEVPTLNYYCYLYYFRLGKLYDWGQVCSPNEVLTSKVNVFMSYNYAYNNPLMYLILW
ncbi:hypothetical protein PHYBLDRAFT_73292 [Phycomyces blakesleeanus NRRL 1555(-)]|uniref:Uncharacterized protein n=1 Tax=Phycomyces blakesleeanus (strain ATCC 8743b / DSM 1359 / FGSC 10004 / NBRC 33097 / NRRL 1555) TaxID=763407 RepID=A0A163CZA3_PHYB8|nr:hypothetical protein PHYBLDRAFT_73292 [Phycomyces blakesleeanus NRRL 1555(-)]OAD67600.1 hypothetical protein PHYBLDRAFT_73292 [Phycomyces blakesleeanus NRRL 1555(-)]|eukprot:XP_018285640.1 hypothetical protein PHYBLDRAFT_73292 [Phycomyces blakesleeanus NRRL 1555(-)]